MVYLIFVVVLLVFQDIPLKPKEEFVLKLDYNFRQRPVTDVNTVRLGDGRGGLGQSSGQGVLPYLILHVTPLALSQEKMRVRILTNVNDRSVQKRVNVNSEIELDLGFTDDMKDRVTPHEYTLIFITSEKKAVEKIVVSIAEDGSFFVNGEKRGIF